MGKITCTMGFASPPAVLLAPRLMGIFTPQSVTAWMPMCRGRAGQAHWALTGYEWDWSITHHIPAPHPSTAHPGAVGQSLGAGLWALNGSELPWSALHVYTARVDRIIRATPFLCARVFKGRLHHWTTHLCFSLARRPGKEVMFSHWRFSIF